jgi:hypothetical protein
MIKAEQDVCVSTVDYSFWVHPTFSFAFSTFPFAFINAAVLVLECACLFKTNELEFHVRDAEKTDIM